MCAALAPRYRGSLTRNTTRCQVNQGLMATWMCAQGWRFVFLIMSALALTVTVLVLVFGIEPRSLKAKWQGERPKAGHGGAAAVWAGLRAMVESWLIEKILCARCSV